MLSALGWSREDRPRLNSKAASSAFPTLSPMVVMKNVLVKQVRGVQVQVPGLPVCRGSPPPGRDLDAEH